MAYSEKLVNRIREVLSDVNQVEQKKMVAVRWITRVKTMKGYVFISAEGMKTKKDLDCWINLALDFHKKAKATKKGK